MPSSIGFALYVLLICPKINFSSGTLFNMFTLLQLSSFPFSEYSGLFRGVYSGDRVGFGWVSFGSVVFRIGYFSDACKDQLFEL